jgi:uncharacterized protein involved in outer membrane biogenesis
MRRLKLAAGVLIAIVAALAVAVYVALSQLDLDTYRETFQARVEAATGRELIIDGPMDLNMDFTPSVTVENVRFANADWSRQDHMASVRRFELELALWPLVTGEVRVSRLILVEPTVRLEVAEDGRANWVFGKDHPASAAKRRRLPQMPAIERIRIEGGKVSYRDLGRGRRIMLMVDRAASDARGAARAADVEVTGSYQGVAFDISGRFGALPGLLSKGTPFPVDLTASAADSRIRVTGEMTRTGEGIEADLALDGASENLARLGPLLGWEFPGMGPLTATSQLSVQGQRYRLSGFRADVGDSDLSGEATVEMGGERPRVSANLTSAVMDVADLSGPAASQDAAQVEEGETPGFIFTEKPLPFATLRGFDGEAEIKIGTLRLTDGLELSSLKAQVVADDGEVSVQPLSSRLGQGMIELGAVIEAARTPPQVTLNATAEKIDYGRLLADMGITDQVSGTAHAEAHLRGTGNSPRALAASLAGQSELVADEGRISEALLATASAGVADALAPWRESEAGMRLNCVVARFDVAEGVMTSRALLADTQSATLGGDGRVSLADEQFDLRLVPRAKQASLMSLAIPMRVTGPLRDPALTPDTLGAAKAGALAIGMIVNPLTALGAILIDSATAEQNPCVAALDKAARQRGEGGHAAGSGDGGTEEGLKGFLEGLSKSIDKQLGVEGNGGEDDPAVLQDGGGATGR